LSIKYIKSDLFLAIKKIDKPILISHVCNNVRSFNSGFVVPLSRHFPNSRTTYLLEPKLELGTTQFIEEDGVYIANMIAQSGIMNQYNLKPLRYEALIKCMRDVYSFVQNKGLEIHCPAFGSCRSGGTWTFIHELIEEIWVNIDVYVYYLDDNQKLDMKNVNEVPIY
jgi:hypothetical protein